MQIFLRILNWTTAKLLVKRSDKLVLEKKHFRFSVEKTSAILMNKYCVNIIADLYYKRDSDRSSCPEESHKKDVLRNFAKFKGKALCQSLFLIKLQAFNKKETLAQVFSCDFCKISKHNFSKISKHFWWLL